MADSAARRGDRTKNLVGFQVGDVRYALEILRVREIINPLPTVALPHAPKVVLGVAVKTDGAVAFRYFSKFSVVPDESER